MQRRFGVNWVTYLALTVIGVQPYRSRAGRYHYPWDGRRTLCSLSIDAHAIDWGRLAQRLRRARTSASVLMLHAHNPGSSISVAALDRLLTIADRYGLAYVTFDELSASATPRAGLALSFDDAAVRDWYAVRDVLARHHARVSFFVSHAQGLDAAEIQMLRELAAAGHAIEAHSVSHHHAKDYVRDHGVTSYVTEEVARSISDLQALGFSPTTYAYPYGESVPAVDRALLAGHVQRIRVGPGSCH